MNGLISNRTIAFLDILAFKFILEKFSLEKIGQTYSDAVELARIEYQLDGSYDRDRIRDCRTQILSDSFIIYSIDDSESSCFTVIKYAQRLMQLFILHQLPVRGAITFGEVYLDEEKNIRLGVPFVRAYELEQRQEWIGVIAENSLEEQFPILFSDATAPPEIIKYPVPFKENHIHEHFVINWMNSYSNNTPLASLNLLPEIYGKQMQIKYANTIKFFEFISNAKS